MTYRVPMLKKILLSALLVLSAMLVIPATSANASGWGAPGGNPQWGNTADGSTPIANRCAGVTTRKFVGDLAGQDGLGVNATIGFNLVNSAGQLIDLGGCLAPGGYSAIVQLNHYVGFAGQRFGTAQVDAKGVSHGRVGPEWAIYHLPANAVAVWIESYTRSYNGSPCGMSCAGDPNSTKYGWVNRRVVPISTYVHLTAPTTPAYHGTTGQIQIKLIGANGQPVDEASCSSTQSSNCVQLYTWSTNYPEGKIVQGWGAAARVDVGQYRFTALASGLASGQPYVIWIDYYGANGAFLHHVTTTTKVFPGYTMKFSVQV